jgi:hypothetical protein
MKASRCEARTPEQALNNDMEIVRQKYFSSRMRTVGVIILVFTLLQLKNGNVHGIRIFAYLFFNLLALTFWITYEIVHIDFAKRQIGEGFKIFGMTRLVWKKYTGIEKIFINSINTVGHDYSRFPWTITVRDKFYKAFLKTADGDKIFLLAGHNKDKLLTKLKTYNQTINTEIIDNSN